MKNSMMAFIVIILVLAVGGFVFVNGKSSGEVAEIKDNTVEVQGGVQKVLISERNLNYYPSTVSVKSGQPVSLSLDSSVTGCLRSFTIRDLGIQKNLRTPEDTLEFTPTQKGTFRFACSMGMGYGTLVVE